ncbi:MAG: hypothetical protein IJT94_01520, partial [Oscillibacter sp.]|nr:hypothetical protein [Oscillibacter sp.]
MTSADVHSRYACAEFAFRSFTLLLDRRPKIPGAPRAAVQSMVFCVKSPRFANGADIDTIQFRRADFPEKHWCQDTVDIIVRLWYYRTIGKGGEELMVY